MANQEHGSLVERVDSLLPSLAANAAKLNESSKSLSAQVDRIDGALQRLNLGVAAWTVVSQGEDGPGCGWTEDLGYDRDSRKSWGLMLRRVVEYYGDPASTEYADWPFNEAPREFRIRAVKHIPNLLKNLDEASQEIVNRLSDSIERTAAFGDALEQVARPQRSIKEKPGRRS